VNLEAEWGLRGEAASDPERAERTLARSAAFRGRRYPGSIPNLERKKVKDKNKEYEDQECHQA
jgi:hypothetical protein